MRHFSTSQLRAAGACSRPSPMPLPSSWYTRDPGPHCPQVLSGLTFVSARPSAYVPERRERVWALKGHPPTRATSPPLDIMFHNSRAVGAPGTGTKGSHCCPGHTVALNNLGAMSRAPLCL